MMMGLFDNIISRPTTGGSERPPRLRKAKSWMGRPRSHGTRQHHWTNSATGSTVDETTANVLTSEEASEHDGKIDSDYISHSGSKTVNDVTFESITPTDPDPKRPKRLVGIISHLRNHRFQRLSSPVREVRSHRRGVDESGDGGTAKLIANPTVSSTANPSVRLTPNPTAKPNPVISQTCSSEKPSEADEAREDRKVSDRTVFTEKSDTAATVCRHPSQRTLTPITIVDRDYNYDNPFEDVRDPAGYNPFTDQERVSSQPSVLDHDDRPPRVLRHSGMLIDRPKNLLSTSRGRFSSKNSSYMSSGEMERSSDSRWSSHFDHRRAAEAFNDLAGRLNLQPLKLCSFNKPASGEESYEPTVEETQLRRRDRIVGRIRVMRSTLTLKVQAVPQGRGLRRMKTFASLPSRSRAPQMVSLRGKSLVRLARLGGHSFLELPADFAPAPLKLPACIVSTARYLRCYAPTVRNVFFDSGDAKMAGRLYDYFAQHVLSAEKEKGQIEMTMRSCDMPPELEIIQPGAPARNTTQVLTAATVFKSLLAGLPGGILGSQDLYRVLVEVYYARSSECDLERTESCLGGASVIDSTKTKAMAHAMLALTSQMQLELICAVFGVCSVLLHETDRLIQIEEDRRGRVRTNFLSGLMNLDRLGRVFGPLLMESREPYPDTFRQVESEIEGERVASMLISNWRFLSRQLRAWEQGGYRYHSRKSVSGSQSLGSIVEGKSGGY